MSIELTRAQLVDETKPAIDALRRNIRLARELALNVDQPLERYDRALVSLNEVEDEMKALVQAEIDREEGR